MHSPLMMNEAIANVVAVMAHGAEMNAAGFIGFATLAFGLTVLCMAAMLMAERLFR